MALLGILVERVAYAPLRESGRLAPVVSALGVSIFAERRHAHLGSRYRAYPVWAALDRRWQVGGVHITLMQGIILGVSIILMLLLYCMIQRTTLGAAIRATAIDQETARLMGIDVNAIIRFIFIIGPALGAVAGVMVGLYYRQLHFTMGWTYSLKAFTAAIMGGIGNIPGRWLGDAPGHPGDAGAGYISAAWKDVLSLSS